MYQVVVGNFANLSEKELKRHEGFLLSGTGVQFFIQLHQILYRSTTIGFSGLGHDEYSET